MSFFAAAEASGLRTVTTQFPLADANLALAQLRAGNLVGAAVLRP
jgi:propanol-preferring alcohol dehydrogenase